MVARSASGWWLGLAAVVMAAAVVALLVVEEPGRQGPARRAASDSEAAGERALALPAGGALAAEALLQQDALPPSDPAAGLRAVSGTVLRASDRSPLAGVPVRASREQTVSDEEGGFSLSAVGEDERSLLVEAAGRPVLVELPEREGDLHGVQLVAQTGWSIPGRVWSEAGSALPGATVLLDGQPRAVSDEGGRFVVHDVQPADELGRVVVTAAAAWHALAEEAVTLQRATLLAPPVELTLAEAGALAGTVVDGRGEPLAGAIVSVLLHVGREGARAPVGLSGTSGEDGRYRLDGIPPGRIVVQGETAQADIARHLQALGYATGAARADEPLPEAAHRPSPAWYADVGVVARAETTLDLELPDGAVVGGRVTDETGRPIENATVRAVRVLRTSLPGAAGTAARFDGLELTVDGGGSALLSSEVGSTFTDARGAYRLLHLPAGESRLEVFLAGRGGPPVEQPLQLVPGERREAVDVVLQQGLSLAGLVLDPAGVPLAGAQVSLLPPQGAAVVDEEAAAVTGADGRFLFDGLPRGERLLFVTHPGHRPLRASVQPGAGDVLVRMEAGPVVEGFVTDATTGAPVPTFHLAVESDTLSMTAQWSDPQGAFLLDSLEPGAYVLTVSAPGYAPARVTFTAGPAAPPLQVRLVPGG